MANERILVVDDENIIRELICSILTQAGYDCRPVTSGEEALALLYSDESYSMVLSDLVMEGMDGLSLLARIRQQHPDIPVVMVTAVHDISVALAAIRNGAYDYLLKPFEREQLLAIVHRAMENRRLKQKIWRTRPSWSLWLRRAPSCFVALSPTWSGPMTSPWRPWAMRSI